MNKTFRRISTKLHLWLATLSGIIIFTVCITGCLYVFKDEINDLTQPWKFIIPEEKPVLLPMQVLDIAGQVVTDATPTAITYGESFDAVFVDYYEPGTGMSTVYIDPYNGRVIHTAIKKNDQFDFFSFVLKGHRTLWLPEKIGKPLVGCGILLFMVMMVTGIVLWWPKVWKEKVVKQNFFFRRHSSPSRRNFDLHKILGGYACLVLFTLAFTGLIWSFEWFSRSVYYVTSGGKELKPYTLPESIVPDGGKEWKEEDVLDKLYRRLKASESQAKTLYFALPQNEKGVFRVSVVHKRGSYYKTDNLFFDRYTLRPLQGTGPYAGKYTEASPADKFRRMNLEIHDGRIFGLFGKSLLFAASLIGASLPVTGFLIWNKRRIKRSE